MPACWAGTVRSDGGDQRSLGLRQLQAFRDFRRYRLDLDAEPAAPGLAMVADLLEHRAGERGRDGKADADAAAGRREDRRVDADDLAGHVEQRAAGVAAVDRRVGLEEFVVGSLIDVAGAGGQDAGGDGPAEAERIADRHHPVADPQGVGVAEAGGGQRLVGLDAQQRQIGQRIGADQFGLKDGVVVERHLDLVGVGHDMVVGDDQTAGIDDEAGAERRHRTRRRLLFTELAEEFLEWRSGRKLRQILAAGTLPRSPAPGPGLAGGAPPGALGPPGPPGPLVCVVEILTTVLICCSARSLKPGGPLCAEACPGRTRPAAPRKAASGNASSRRATMERRGRC